MFTTTTTAASIALSTSWIAPWFLRGKSTALRNVAGALSSRARAPIEPGPAAPGRSGPPTRIGDGK
jgi:hypothetical protein